MQDDYRNTLEDLFSDMPAPEPEGEPSPPSAEGWVPPEPEPAPAAPLAQVSPGLPEGDVTADQPKEAGPAIRTRLTRGFALILALVLVVSIADLWIVRHLGQTNGTLREEADRAAAAVDVARSCGDLLIAMGSASSTQDPDDVVAAVTDAQARLQEAERRFDQAILDLPSSHPVWEEAERLQIQIRRTSDLADTVVAAAQAGDWSDVEFYQTQLSAGHQRMLVESAERVAGLTRTLRDTAAAEAAVAQRLAVVLPLAFSGLLLGATAIVGLLTTRSVTGPVDRLLKSVRRLASGHLEERVPVERDDELGHLAAAFNQMATQMQTCNTELERALQLRLLEREAAQQLEAGVEIGRAILSIFDLELLLRKATSLIQSRLGFHNVAIFLLDDTREWLVLAEAGGRAHTELRTQRIALDETTLPGWAALHRQPRTTADLEQGGGVSSAPLLPNARSEIALPIAVGRQLIGVLSIQSMAGGTADPGVVRALQVVADQLAVAIENARRISDEAFVLEVTSPVYRASRRLTTATTPQEVADAIIDSVAETGADGCVVVEFELSARGVPQALLYRGVWRRDREPQFKPGMRLPVSESPFPMDLVSSLWATEDVREDARIPTSARRVFEATEARALANIPLRIGEGVFGQVVVLRTSPGPFSSSAVQLYEALSDQASVAMERVRLLEAARRRAEEEATLRAIGDRLSQAIDRESLLQTASQELAEALGAAGVYIELGPRPDSGSSPQEQTTQGG
jgi:GAF domain-containing protein/HAMP domain-containing protein